MNIRRRSSRSIPQKLWIKLYLRLGQDLYLKPERSIRTTTSY